MQTCDSSISCFAATAQLQSGLTIAAITFQEHHLLLQKILDAHGPDISKDGLQVLCHRELLAMIAETPNKRKRHGGEELSARQEAKLRAALDM